MANNSFICVDLGASNTRYSVDDGIMHWMPNNVAIIKQDENTRMEVWDSNNLDERINQHLDVTIEKTSGESSYFPLRALVGKIADRYTSVSDKPTGMENKHTQRITYINAIVATAVSRLATGDKGDKMNEVYMYLALPPVEASRASDYVNKELCGEYKVTFNMLGEYVNLHIKSVKCMEESLAAITTFFFSDGKPTDKVSKYGNGYVLSIDIGASTTDLVAVQNMRYLERTGKTIKIGGNVVRDYVIDDIMSQDNIDLNLDSAEAAVAEGRVQTGMSYIDCSEIVSNAKSMFAEQIVNNMQTYFKQIGIPIQSFMAIVVSGGGSMPGGYIDNDGISHKTSESMAYFITEKLKGVCSTIAVEYIDDNPRLANIKGLFNRAIFDKAKRERNNQ